MCFQRSSGQLLLDQTKNIHVRWGTKAGRKFLRHIQTVCAWRHEFKERRQLRGVNEHNLVPIPTNNNHRDITNKSISLHLINAKSVAGKAVSLCEHITEKCVDILAITDTWLREGDDRHINDRCPPGYKFVGVPRPTSKGARGGGVGFVIKANIDVICIPQKEIKHSKLALPD